MIVLVYVAILINQFIPITSHNSESDGLLGSGAGRPRKKVSRQYTNEYLRRLTPNESYFSIKLGKYIPGGYNTTEDGAEVERSGRECMRYTNAFDDGSMQFDVYLDGSNCARKWTSRTRKRGTSLSEPSSDTSITSNGLRIEYYAGFECSSSNHTASNNYPFLPCTTSIPCHISTTPDDQDYGAYMRSTCLPPPCYLNILVDQEGTMNSTQHACWVDDIVNLRKCFQGDSISFMYNAEGIIHPTCQNDVTFPSNPVWTYIDEPDINNQQGGFLTPLPSIRILAMYKSTRNIYVYVKCQDAVSPVLFNSQWCNSTTLCTIVSIANADPMCTKLLAEFTDNLPVTKPSASSSSDGLSPGILAVVIVVPVIVIILGIAAVLYCFCRRPRTEHIMEE